MSVREQLGSLSMSWGAGENTTSLSGLFQTRAVIGYLLFPWPLCLLCVISISCWAELVSQFNASQLFEIAKENSLTQKYVDFLKMSKGKWRRQFRIAQLPSLPIPSFLKKSLFGTFFSNVSSLAVLATKNGLPTHTAHWPRLTIHTFCFSQIPPHHCPSSLLFCWRIQSVFTPKSRVAQSKPLRDSGKALCYVRIEKPHVRDYALSPAHGRPSEA